MEQTELLWLYQQADMAADAFESVTPPASPLRKTANFW